MIKVKRLGHATITTPDLEAQVDYYSRRARPDRHRDAKDRVFLGEQAGPRSDRAGARQAQRPEAAVVPGRARYRSRRRGQGAAEGRASRASDAADISPGVAEAVTLRRPQGHADRSLCRLQFRQARQHADHLQHPQARPRRLSRARRAEDREVLLRRARLPGVGLARRFLRVPALQHRPPHAQLHHRREAAASSHRLRGRSTGRRSTRRSTISPTTMSTWSGGRAATSSATTSRPITATTIWCASRFSPRWTR